MGIPMLNQCCCGCTLKTGSIIIGALNVIAGVSNLATGIVAASYTTDAAHQGDSVSALHAAGAIIAAVGALVLIMGALLCIGAMKDMPNLLIPYMVMAVISIISNIITQAIMASNYYKVGDSTQGTSAVIGILLFLFLQTYFLLVVYSLYRQLKGIAHPMNP